MKKIIYLLMIMTTGVFFTSCDPLEDIDNELNAQEDIISGEIKFTLTDDDYDELGLSFGNFSSIDDAKSMIPSLLEDKFPVWGVGSSADVTFELFARKQEQDSIVRYTVTTEDYDSNPETERFNNFDDNDQIFDLLNVKYPTPVDNMLVSLTYDFYDGRVNELNNGFFYTSGEWQFVNGLTDDEYNLVGESFPNFSNEDEADEKMPLLLLDKFKYDFYEAGDIVPTMYKLFVTDVSDLDGDGRTDDRTTYSFIKYFIFDGTNWSVYDNTIEESVKFGHNGTVWVPDNTITYTLTSADFALVGNGTFNNFDVREGRGEADEQVRIDKINIILKNNFPNSEQGQKYLVKYAVWTGGPDVFEIKLILEGADYIKFVE